MKCLDQRNKPMRTVLDLVFLRLQQHHKFWDLVLSRVLVQIREAVGLGLFSQIFCPSMSF